MANDAAGLLENPTTVGFDYRFKPTNSVVLVGSSGERG